MATVRLTATASAFVKDTVPAWKSNSIASVASSASPAVDGSKLALVFKPASLPSGYAFKRLTKISLGFYHSSALSSATSTPLSAKIAALQQAYNYSTVSFNVQADSSYLPKAYKTTLSPYSPFSPSVSEFAVSVIDTDSLLKTYLQGISNGFLCLLNASFGNVETTLYGYTSSNKPYVDLEFSDSTPYLTPTISSPAAGSLVNLNKSTSFTFGLDTSHANFAFIGDIYAGSAKLKWRDGPSGTVHTVNATSLSGKKVTVAAGTFPRSANLQYQIEITDGAGTTSSTAWTSFSTDLKLTASDLSPASGYVDETKANTFSWRLAANGSAHFADLTATASVKIQWRASSSGSINTINASSLYNGAVPANTLPSTGSPQWRVQVTDSYGNVTTSNWMTLTTTDSIGTATPITPINTIVSGGGSARFEWGYDSVTGSAPSGATIAYSADGSSWSTLKTVSGSALYTDINLSAFSGGQFYWRVRANNNDGVAGPWSPTVSFVLLSPPLTPSVSATQTPRPTVTWQAAGQQAYQVLVDGLFDSGVVFGTAKSYKLPIILPDGQQIIKVRVQNSYGLWSGYGSAAVYVHNSPGGSIDLSATMTRFSARLTWTASGYNRFLIYRDGKAIGLTTSKNYIDHLIAGEAEYRVVGIVNSTDMYQESNAVTLCLRLKHPVLADAAAPEWFDLALNDSDVRTVSLSTTRNVYFRHYTGAHFPAAEASNEYDTYISFDAAFVNMEQAAAVNGLVGKKVIFKDKTGAYVGILSARRTSSTFFDTLSFDLRVVENDEEVHL